MSLDFFVHSKTEDAALLTQGKDDNEAVGKKDVADIPVLGTE